MKIGLTIFLTDYSIHVVSLARRAEALGFESLWLPEHPIIPVRSATPWPGAADGEMPQYYRETVDPFVALAHASAVTTRLRIATGICLLPERDPLVLAKQVASLDYFSGGRFIFGIGAGWLREETEIMGGDFDHRWTQAKESVMAMKALWAEAESEFHGKYYDFPPVHSFPKPAQRPHPPVILAGTAANVHKRIADWGDGWLPIRISPEEVRAGREKLNALAAASGRDPAGLTISIYGVLPEPETVRAYADAGADRVVLRLDSSPEAETLVTLKELAKKLF
tara:strand:+ start:502 stop:1344 length:843 start_codon:yes stop_codon:yes gene_type:complete